MDQKALRSSPYLRLPQELWHSISEGLSTLSLLGYSRAFRNHLTRNQAHHSRVWSAIFKNDTWLNMAMETFGIRPVIISRDLDRFNLRSQYMVLVSRDPLGDLFYSFGSQENRESFLNALQENSGYNPERGEVTFTSGIVLNIHNLFFSREVIEVEPRKLFRREKLLSVNRVFRGKELLSTQYMHFNDSQCKLLRAKPDDFAGLKKGTMRENITNPKDPGFYCEMSLTGLDNEPFKLSFEKQPRAHSSRPS